jgi:hypothetical protein
LSAEKFHGISPGMQSDDNLRTPTRSSLTTFNKTLERLPADGISAALWKARELGMSCRQLYV